MSITIGEALERLANELVVVPAGTLVGYRSELVEGEWKRIEVKTDKTELVKIVVNRAKLCGLILGSVECKGGVKTGGALQARHVRGARQKAAGGRS